MTKVYLNSKHVETKLKESDTLLDLINSFDREDFANDTITSIELDESSIYDFSNTDFLKDELSNYKNINIILKSNLDLAREALDSSSKYVSELIEKIEYLAGLYEKDDIAMANKNFTETIDILDLFFQLITSVYRTFKKEELLTAAEIKMVEDLEIHLLGVLKAIVPAQEKNDIILLSDLLKYELKDNLLQWKIKAIPAIQKQIKSK